MRLGERIRELRKERAWSQTELAEKIGSDARQISRYENERITPSVEALVKLAEVFEVSTDYLLLESAARRLPVLPSNGLLERLQGIEELSEEDKTSLLHILDALLVKNKVRALAQHVG